MHSAKTRPGGTFPGPPTWCAAPRASGGPQEDGARDGTAKKILLNAPEKLAIKTIVQQPVAGLEVNIVVARTFYIHRQTSFDSVILS